ncbi:MAG TPA: hypothetical protein VIK59_12850 [Verrucomicrobiae bacterium]
MIVNRKPLTFWEKLYLPAIIGGVKVTMRHALSHFFVPLALVNILITATILWMKS